MKGDGGYFYYKNGKRVRVVITPGLKGGRNLGRDHYRRLDRAMAALGRGTVLSRP